MQLREGVALLDWRRRPGVPDYALAAAAPFSINWCCTPSQVPAFVQKLRLPLTAIGSAVVVVTPSPRSASRVVASVVLPHRGARRPGDVGELEGQLVDRDRPQPAQVGELLCRRSGEERQHAPQLVDDRRVAHGQAPV